MKKVLMIVVLLLMAGCINLPTKEELANADYGPCPEQYETIIKDYMEYVLFDSDSAKYKFGSVPYKGWMPVWDKSKPNSPFMKDAYGWIVRFSINAKNRMGAYVGYKAHLCIIKNDKIIDYQQVYE